MFAPDVSGAVTRDGRTTWLRWALRQLIPSRETKDVQLIGAVTGHSFRPGLAGDLLREGESVQQIALVCRWQGVRNARMYAERPALSAFMRTNVFRVITC